MVKQQDIYQLNYNQTIQICFIEPLHLKFGHEYNLNNVKEIEVTDEFLNLDKIIKQCQNDESLEDCKTRKYIDTLLNQCNCLPFAIRNNKKVFELLSDKISIFYLLESLCIC